MPTLTVGIPTRNRREPLFNLIASLQGQTLQGFELIVSDDGDLYDLPAEILRAFPDLAFRYVRGPRKNLPANRQNILDHARTELVVMCDDDHIMKQDCLEQLYRTAIQSEAIGVVSAIWPRPVDSCIDYEQVKHLEDFRLTLSDINRESHYWWRNGWKTFAQFHAPDRLLESEFAGGGCLLYRKTAVASAGGFPTYYSPVSFREDTDMSHRIFLKGYKVLVNTRAIAYHDPSPAGGCRDLATTDTLRELDGRIFLLKLEEWRSDLKDRSHRRPHHDLQQGSMPTFSSAREDRTSPEVKSILWIRPDSIGDAVLAASMLPHIRRKYPSAQITAVCQPHLAEFYEPCPFVDRTFTFERVRTYEDENYRNEVIRNLRELRCDLTLNSVYSREPLTDLLALAGQSRQRIALVGNLTRMTADMRDRHNRQYTQLVSSDRDYKLELERHRDFLRGLGIDAPPLQPVLWLTAHDEQYAEELLRAHRLDPMRTIVLFAGAQVDVRLYEQYGNALASICRERELSVVAVGSAHESEINRRNLKVIGTRTVDVCGQTSIRQTAALLKRCLLAVGAETGTAHIACAVGTPHVVLLGGGHFGRFMPYSPLTAVACLPLACYACDWQCRYPRPHCVRDVHPEVIAAAVRQSLEGSSDKIRVFHQSPDSWGDAPSLPAWADCSRFLEPHPFELRPVVVSGVTPKPKGQRGCLPSTQPGTTSPSPLTSHPPLAPRPAGYRVSAIISTYNSERFLRGRLENLVGQSLYGQGQLEIIVVDSGSQQNESALVREFQQHHPHVRLIRTEQRETVYQAWNRGIREASGRYLTNQNTDDRMSPTALERLADHLDAHPDTVLVHGDQQAVPSGVEPDCNRLNGKPHWQWHPFSRLGLLISTQVGSQPMWRRSLHDKHGYFDPDLRIRGDQDFFVRIAGEGEFHFIPDILGTIATSPDSVSSNQELSAREQERIFRKYTSREEIAPLLGLSLGRVPTADEHQALANHLICSFFEEAKRVSRLPLPVLQLMELGVAAMPLGAHAGVLLRNLLRMLQQSGNIVLLEGLKSQGDPRVLERALGEVRSQPLFERLALPKATGKDTGKRVSIIIPVHNQSAMTRQCLQAIEETAGAGICEIIIVDNASTDETQEYVESLGSRVKVHRNASNEPFARACNQGAALATSPCLVFLNNDTKPLPGWIEALLEEFDASPEVGIQGAKLLYADGAVQHAGMVFGCRAGRSEEPYHPYLRIDARAAFVNRRRLVQFVTGACLAIRRDLFERIGGFDEGYIFGWEDSDLCMKARFAGAKTLYNPKAALYHFESVTKKLREERGEVMTDREAPHELRNRARFFAKWGDVVERDADRFYAEDGLQLREGRWLEPLSAKSENAPSSQPPQELLTSFSPQFWQRNYEKASRVLFRCTGAIGDSLYTTAILADLKRQFPNLEICVSGDERVEWVFRHHPDMAGYLPKDSEAEQRYARTADAIVDYHNVIARLPEYYNGLGYMDILANLAGVRLSRRDIVYTLEPDEAAWAKRERSSSGASRWIGLQFNTSKDIKRSYPHGGRLMEVLWERYPDLHFVLFGEDGLTRSHPQVYDCKARQVPFRHQVALAHQCHAFITVDSAFFHVAHNLCHRPTLVIFGPTNPMLCGNLQAGFVAITKADLECLSCYWQRSCGIECMRDLAPTAVADEFHEMMSAPERRIQAWPRPPDKVRVVCSPRQAIEESLIAVLCRSSEAVSPVLEDPNNILPPYSRSWNGVTLAGSCACEHPRGETPSAATTSRQGLPSHLERVACPCCGSSEAIPFRQLADLVKCRSCSTIYLGTRFNKEAMVQFYQRYADGESHMAIPRNREQAKSSPLRREYFLREILEFVTPQGTLVDIGCGWGAFLDHAREEGFEPRGVEINRKVADFANNQLQVSVTSEQFIDTPFQDGSVAVVTMLHTLEHLPDPLQAVEKAYTILEPGGIFCGIVPNIESLCSQIEGEQWEWLDPACHYVHYSPTTLRALLERAGFSVERLYTAVDDYRREPIDEYLRNRFGPASEEDRARQLKRIEEAGLGEAIRFFARKPGSSRRTLTPATPGPVPKQFGIVWEGSQFVHHSLALINRELTMQLIAAGHDLCIIPYEPDQFGAEADLRFEMIASRIRSPLSTGVDVHVRHQWPPNFTPPPTGHWVMIQPWEYGRLPVEWIEPITNLVDEVWVPSTHVLKTYLASGIPAGRVKVVPNGVNVSIFKPQAQRYPITSEKRFKFLFVGGTIWRKGVDVLLEAYRTTFRREDDVVLVIKDMGQNSFYRNQDAARLIAGIQQDPRSPEISYLTDSLGESDIAGLYNSCDCLVHPYRGEGFGLPVLEAMACGLPVIVTAGGATDDFCAPDEAFLVPAKPRRFTSQDVSYVGGAGWVLEPDLNRLRELLREVFEQPEAAKRRARNAMERVRREYTWEKVAQQLVANIDSLVSRPVRRMNAGLEPVSMKRQPRQQALGR